MRDDWSNVASIGQAATDEDGGHMGGVLERVTVVKHQVADFSLLDTAMLLLDSQQPRGVQGDGSQCPVETHSVGHGDRCLVANHS